MAEARSLLFARAKIAEQAERYDGFIVVILNAASILPICLIIHRHPTDMVSFVKQIIDMDAVGDELTAEERNLISVRHPTNLAIPTTDPCQPRF